MQHLKVLEKAGIIRVERQGRYRWNHLNHGELEMLRQQMLEHAHRAKPTANTLPVINIERAHIEETFRFPVPQARLFAALTLHIGHWWHNAGTSILLEPQPGGRLWQQIDTSGNGILFATVDRLIQDDLLGLYGTMGSDTSLSIIRFRLREVSAKTELLLEQRFIGEVSVTVYEAFQQSWQELLGIHLRGFLENGSE